MRPKRGLTILEMTIVLMVLMVLVKMGMSGFSKVDQWRLGRAASETLRTVYSAQRMYLADNPMTPVANLTDAMLIPYLPSRNSAAVAPLTLVDAFQTVKPLSGAALNFNVTVSPPRFTQVGNYDPSAPVGANPDAVPKDPGFTDSLWDVGE